MKKETNNETQNKQNEEPKPKHYSRRSFYMNKKNNLENKTTNAVEPKKEQKIQVVKKIIKKEKKPYIHHSHPKLKLKNMNIEDNNKDNNILGKIKKYNSSKIMINVEKLHEKILSTKNKNIKINKYSKYNKQSNKVDKLNKSQSVKNIEVKVNTTDNNTNKNYTNKIQIDKNAEINNKTNKITVNLKQENCNNESNTSNKVNSTKTEANQNKIHSFKSPTTIHSNPNLNQNNNNKRSQEKKTTNINVISSKTNTTKNVVEVKKNKAQSKMDALKSQGKSQLLGAPKKECTVCHKYIETHLLLIHMNIHTSQIFKWLYLGSFENACDLKELRRNKILFVLNCAKECNNEKLPKEIKELHLNVKDDVDFDIMRFFDQSNEFINNVRTKGGSILVHCKLGLSRSPTIIAAYLVKYFGFNVNSALTFIRKKRPKISPNQGFIEQLQEYENTFKKRSEKK